MEQEPWRKKTVQVNVREQVGITGLNKTKEEGTLGALLLLEMVHKRAIGTWIVSFQ